MSGEGTEATVPGACLSQRIADRSVPRREQGGDLLDGGRLANLDMDRHLVSDETGLFNYFEMREDVAPVSHNPEFGHFRDAHSRLTGTSGQGDGAIDRACLDIDKVIFVELAVAGDAGVGNPPVDA